jgi:release factor glutamine methyltransferase
VRFEPVTALVSGKDGLDDIRHIIVQSASHLLPGGWLLLEHGYDQAARVCGLLEASKFEAVFSACDLAGIERASGGRKTA